MTGFSYEDNGPFAAGNAEAMARQLSDTRGVFDNSNWQVTTGGSTSSGTQTAGAKSLGDLPSGSKLLPWLVGGAALVGLVVWMRRRKK